MKLARPAIAKALDRPDSNIRLYLFHGADEGQSRSHAQRLMAGLGAARLPLSPSALKSDPAQLADEAGAISLFGESRLLWIEGGTDDLAPAIEALLEAAAVQSPAAVIAGPLRKTSALVKIADSSPLALSYVSYVPEGQDADRMVAEVGRTLGLNIPRSVAARVAASCGSDQAIVRQELIKLALFADARPEAPKELDHDALDAVGADLPEGNFMRIADLALTGDLAQLGDELSRLSPSGAEAIPIVRSLQRRLLQLAPARARVESGEAPAAVMTSIEKSLFFKDKALVGQLLRHWDAKGLARALDRIGALERDLMLASLPPVESLAEELITIGRAARRN